MRKFTIIILLLCISFGFTASLNAQNADINLLRKLNNDTPTGLRNFSSFVSNTTYITVVAVPVIMGSVALISKDDELLKNTFSLGIGLAINTGLTLGLKYSINRQRPYEKYPGMLDVPYPESSPSMPSAHTSVAFATATSLTLHYPKWYIIAPSYLWACSVAYSRMNLGVHYPTDVLAGAALGAASAYASYKLNQWFWKKLDNKKILGRNKELTTQLIYPAPTYTLPMSGQKQL